jgi:hypothetical protein
LPESTSEATPVSLAPFVYLQLDRKGRSSPSHRTGRPFGPRRTRQSGVSILTGNDLLTNAPQAYIGDAEFSSPSAAAAVIHGGSANGLISWKTADGKLLKELDEHA